MRVFLDTNILISAILNPFGAPARAYERAVCAPFSAVLCEQNLQELRSVFERKFPSKCDALEDFISVLCQNVAVIPVPTIRAHHERLIRDYADRPILRAALTARADILLTGDKDFLESGLEQPKIMTAPEFLEVPVS